MNEKECKREIYKFDSGLLIRSSGALGFVEHALPQNVVCTGLVTFTPLFQPGHHVGVEAHRDSLLQGPIKSAAECAFPCIGRELRNIGCFNIWRKLMESAFILKRTSCPVADHTSFGGCWRLCFHSVVRELLGFRDLTPHKIPLHR